MKKIKDEAFKLNKNKKENIIMSDSEINAKYKRGEIRIITEQARYPIKNIKSMIESNDYKLNPEYQRRKRWDNVRKSKLIESFIMNVPLPPIFLYEYEYSKYEVMDGLQRLTSIVDFYSNEFALEGLEYWTELNGKKYSELPIEVKKGVDRRYISSIILLEETAKTPKEAEELKQIVFERLNSGGEKLTSQETRNALYPGKFNKLCIKLSENKKFKIMLKIPCEEDELIKNTSYRKMVDVELVLRFFAYRFLKEFKTTKEKFLDEYLKQANRFSSETVNQLEILFIKTINIVWEIFGEDAFLLPKNERTNKKPTTVIYDPLMQSISNFLEYENKILEKKTLIKNLKSADIHKAMASNGKLLFDGKYDHKAIVEQRVKYFNSLIENILKK
jgi:hypothetical protein